MLRGVPPPRDVAWGAAGAAVGFLPWLAYNAPRGWPGLARLIEVFGAEDREEFLAQGLGDRVLELLARVPSEGLLDPGGDLVGSPWRLLLFVGVLLPAGLALLVGALRMLRMARRWRSAGVSNDPERLELVFWLYGLLFAAVYLVSRFTLEVEPTPIAYRLMVPPAVFLLVPLAISAARGLRARGWQRAVAAAGVGLALSSLAASTTLFALRHHGDGLPTTFDRGYLLVGHLALRKYPRSVQRAVAEVRPVRDARNRRAALRGVAWGLVEDYEHGGASLEGLQRGVMSLHEPDRTQVWRNVESIAAFRRGELVRAYGRTGDASFANAMQRIDRLLALFPIRRDAGSPAEDGLAPVSGLR